MTVAVLIAAEFVTLPILCTRVISEVEASGSSTELALREKIAELEVIKDELVTVKKELATLKLKAVKTAIIKGKTRDKDSPLYFDVSVLTPSEQLRKIDQYLEKLGKI